VYLTTIGGYYVMELEMPDTCAVSCQVNDQSNRPVKGALVSAALSAVDVYRGYVAPHAVDAETDANGIAVLNLWPNQLGATATHYKIRITTPSGKQVRTTAVVPNAPTAQLHLISDVPPFEGKTAAYILMDTVATAAAKLDASITAAQATALALTSVDDAAGTPLDPQALERLYANLRGPQGAKGDTGLRGPTGLQGIQGLKGDSGSGGSGTGAQGATGAKGDAGVAGADGAQGAKGDAGDQGLQGYQGVEGAIGPQGERGATGQRGIQGLTGLNGSAGLRGDTGLSGAAGDTGAQGPQGVQGLTGVKGDTGAQGATGAQGVTGTTGATGEQGIKGDVGAQGEQGFQGIQGFTGAIGATGAQGIQGNIGAKGDTGDTGAQGIQGRKGDTGDTGLTGDTGIQGIQGLTGDVGAKGDIGLTGDKGDAGLKGDTGAQGTQGVQGIQGLTGDVGLKGDTGAQGIQGAKGDAGAARFKRTAWANPTGSSSTLTQAGLMLVSVGTLGSTTVTTVNVHQMMRRVYYSAITAAVTAIAGARNISAQWFRGTLGGKMGGFNFLCRFGPSIGAAANATRRGFCGFNSLAMNPTDANPSTLANVLGVGCDAADTTYQIMYRSGTSAVTKIDTGISKSAADFTEVYELEMNCIPGGDVTFKFTNLTTDEVFTHTATTNLPLATVLLNPQLWYSVGGTSSVIGASLMHLSIDTDY
jgi:hypothetical protein